MVLSWLRARRRKYLLQEPFPHEWRAALAQHVRHWQFLNEPQRQRLEGCIQVMAAEKDWVGGSGAELNDDMKVVIAGYAGIMTLGLPEPYYFDRLKTIIVYPQAYEPHVSRYDRYPEFHLMGPRLGEMLHRGPVVVSWSEIVSLEKERPGNNLVIHEFAHHVDGLDGTVDGTPPLVGREQEHAWYQVTEAEFQRLAHDAARGEATLLDQYGVSNRAEFFAVASECFFERPRALCDRHPALYCVLADFYCQDPATWLPDAG